jgi:hypothetical protein
VYGIVRIHGQNLFVSWWGRLHFTACIKCKIERETWLLFGITSHVDVADLVA